jgi:tetratricopeptide (TPR) repeat protein
MASGSSAQTRLQRRREANALPTTTGIENETLLRSTAMPIPVDQLPAIAESLTKIIGLAGLTGAVMDTEGFAHHLGARLKSGSHNERKINFARAFLETDETIPEESKKWIRQRLNPGNKDMKALFAASSNAEVQAALTKLELIPNQDNLETHHQTLYDLMCNALFKEGDAAKRVAFVQESMREVLRLLHTLHGKLAAKTRLEVRSKTWDRNKNISPSRLLQPEYQTVHFKYRETEIQDLNDWLQGDGLKIRLYTAAGGTGKTRLFQEWCRQKQNVSWQAGFFKPNPTDTAALLELDSPLIIVIDYAESEQEHLIEFLKTCEAQIPQRSSPIRVVLLEREKQVLEASINQHRREIEALDSFKTIALEALSTTRENIYGDARAAFSEKLTGTPFHTQAIPDLNADVYNRVLMIHIRALLDTQPLPLTSDNTLDTPRGLLDAMLDRERDLWDKNLRAKNMGAGNEPLKDGLRDALAMTTLGHHSNDRTNLERLLQVVFPDKDAQTRSNLADVLATTHPNGYGGIEALQPDLLGERLVQLALEGSRRDAIIHALFCNPDMPVDFLRAFTVISRLSGWQAQSAHKIMDDIQAAVMHHPTRALEINDLLHSIESTVLLNMKMVMSHFAMEVAERDFEARPTERHLKANYARRAGNHANHLGNAGYRNDAAQIGETVTKLFRELARDNPQAFNPDLALSLHNIGSELSRLERHEEALEVTQEALGIRRQLAQNDPKNFIPDLAMTLSNFGIRLGKLGRFEQALEAAQEAFDFYHKLAQDNPKVFAPYLAASFDNLGIILSFLRRHREALDAAQDAVKLRRVLARDNPQVFSPDLAKSLNNLGPKLSELRRQDESLAAMQEGSDIYRDLARDNPQVFSPEFAMSLSNLGSSFSDLGQHEKAIEATREAVEIWHKLATSNPDEHNPNFAKSLYLLGDCLKESGQISKAHPYYEKAIRILAPHFFAIPNAFAGQIAKAIENYLESCKALNLALDTELLNPIFQKLKELMATE